MNDNTTNFMKRLIVLEKSISALDERVKMLTEMVADEELKDAKFRDECYPGKEIELQAAISTEKLRKLFHLPPTDKAAEIIDAHNERVANGKAKSAGDVSEAAE